LDQVRDLADRRLEGALGGEGAHVQLVDDGSAQVTPAPSVIAPGEPGVVVDPAGPEDPVRLPPAARVRIRLPAVQPEGVVGAVIGVRDLGPPPAAAGGVHGMTHAADLDLDRGGGRRPYLEHHRVAPSSTSLSSRATG